MQESAIIAAVQIQNNIIGWQGGIPWDIASDLAWFRDKTSGHAVIMGRHTFESLKSVPLPNRQNIVVSSKLLEYDGVTVCKSVEEAIQAVGKYKTYFCIGGQKLYEAFMGIVDTMYITEVDKPSAQGDTFFPIIDKALWKRSELTSWRSQPEKYCFVKYTRKN